MSEPFWESGGRWKDPWSSFRRALPLWLALAVVRARAAPYVSARLSARCEKTASVRSRVRQTSIDSEETASKVTLCWRAPGSSGNALRPHQPKCFEGTKCRKKYPRAKLRVSRVKLGPYRAFCLLTGGRKSGFLVWRSQYPRQLYIMLSPLPLLLLSP